MKYIREKDKIYFAEKIGSEGYDYLFISNATDGYSAYIAIGKSSNTFKKSSSDSSYSWNNHYTVRSATESERQWFELCLKNNKLMPKPELKENNYEIY